MRFILLLIAAVVAVVAGVVALQWSNKNAPAPTASVASAPAEGQPVNAVEILVARDDIPIGTVIEESMVDKQPWPEHLLLEGFVVSGTADANVAGKVARVAFQAREPFSASKLANPNDPSFLAAQLPAGMRAVTMATDTVSGLAGYVFPGDRVDVLLTHNVPAEIEAQKAGGSAGSRPAVAEVLVVNVRVLAVNVRPAGKEARPTTPSSITLEMKDEDTQRLRLAEKIGTLSLVLRSLKDKDMAGVPEPIVLRGLTHVGQEREDGDSVRVVRGAGSVSQSPVAAAPVADDTMDINP
jgi:pilus assembly protein CpaB